jgi:hypothetical protein
MKHIASIVKDGQVSYALVDEDSGTVTQFAQILVPEHFDLHSSAMLGHNLVEVIGLNGKRVRSPKRQPPAVGQTSLLELDAVHDEPQVTHFEPEPKPAKGKGAGRGAPGRKRAAPDPANAVGYYISLERVVEVINQYPDGIMSRQIADRIWRLDGNPGDVAPKWVTRSVENRVSGVQIEAKKGKKDLPFRVEYRPAIGINGQPTRQQSKYLLPLEGAS